MSEIEKKPDRSLVVRSQVPAKGHYGEYRQELRKDFFFSCAYCTMAETEARAIRFTIDHYYPQKHRPELKNHYDNLMYCCDECNSRKGDRISPDDATQNGHRVFRPDHDVRSDHFQLEKQDLKPRTNTGSYSIDVLDLNRQALRRLRDLRDRVYSCGELVAEGVLALRNFQLDQLPKGIRGSALKSIGSALDTERSLSAAIDDLLGRYAASELIDPEDRSEVDRRTTERNANLNAVKALYPGHWRGPRNSQARG